MSNDPFGSSIDLFYGFRPDMRIVSGVDALVSRLSCRLEGQTSITVNIDSDKEYGIDLNEWVNGSGDIVEIQSLSTQIEEQLNKDPEVETVNCDVEFDESTLTITLTITGTSNADPNNPFSFVGTIAPGKLPVFVRS